MNAMPEFKDYIESKDELQKINYFIGELQKYRKLYPYQEELLRQVLINKTPEHTICLVGGRHCGRRYLQDLYNKIFATNT